MRTRNNLVSCEGKLRVHRKDKAQPTQNKSDQASPEQRLEITGSAAAQQRQHLQQSHAAKMVQELWGTHAVVQEYSSHASHIEYKENGG